MTWQTRLLYGMAAMTLATGLGGCTTCHHQASSLALAPANGVECSIRERHRVHVFLINDAVPIDYAGLTRLRNCLNEAGFPQIYHAYPHNIAWLKSEIRQVACDDPEARIITVGYALGAGVAKSLAYEAERYGLAVDAVVLLDPATLVEDTSCQCQCPPIVLGSRQWHKLYEGKIPEGATILDANHLELPYESYTVELLSGILRESVVHVPIVEESHLIIPLVDHPPPLPEIVAGEAPLRSEDEPEQAEPKSPRTGAKPWIPGGTVPVKATFGK